MSNLYEILGVPKTANESEIKKAYRTLSLKYHPDRNSSEDAASKIREINDAYETLSDPAKKQQYDSPMQFGNMAGGHGEDFPDINNLFQMLFSGGLGMHGGMQQGMRQGMPQGMHGGGGGPEIRIFHGGQNPFMNGMPHMFQSMQKPAPIIKNLIISLEQAYHGCSVPIEIEKWTIANDIKSSELETIYITIPPGIDENEILIMHERGNVISENNKGDIKLTIQIQNNTPFIRHGNDLIYKKTICLKEALCGFSFELSHLNGKVFSLNNNTNKTIIKPNFKKVIPKLGMSRNNTLGNLIIDFDVSFPETLTDEQIKVISETLSS
jgi:DnaJ-class molecular chaperone